MSNSTDGGPYKTFKNASFTRKNVKSDKKINKTPTLLENQDHQSL